MKYPLLSRNGRPGPAVLRRLAALGLMALGLTGRAAAQVPPPPAGDGPPPLGIPAAGGATASAMTSPFPDDPLVPQAPTLPRIAPQAPQPVAPFIDGLRGNDATFEVVVGQGRILTTKEDITAGQAQPLVAVGDPSVIVVAVLSPRQLRVTGQRVGVTDLSITTAAGQTVSFEVRVVADLSPLTARLKEAFPDANLRLAQLREDVIVEGQARDAAQVANIIQTIRSYLQSVEVGQTAKIQGQQGAGLGGPPGAGAPPGGALPNVADPNGLAPGQVAPGQLGPGQVAPAPDVLNPAGGIPGAAGPNVGGPLQIQSTIAASQVINLIRLPGSQQVLLKVRVAELNRSALRQIGANFLGVDPGTGAIVGTQIAGPVAAVGTIGQVPPEPGMVARTLAGGAQLGLNGAQSTVFGIFQDSEFEFTLNALRRNAMLKILAEPNLVALHGHQASFLAGGEFPVPVPQVSSGGATPTVTVQFREFGVRLNFLPYIMDGDVVRLAVAPEVSQIDPSIATTLVAGGTPVPGLNTRKAQTTVELQEGQTLAIAGLMQLQLDGTTNRIPVLGDLPVLGPFFSNTTSGRVEKELVVLVTPYLIEPMTKGQVPPTPGDEVKGPNDLEFFLLNRIEGRTGKDHRATTAWDDPLQLMKLMKLERKYVNGPSGLSD